MKSKSIWQLVVIVPALGLASAAGQNCCFTTDVDGDNDLDCVNVADQAACTAAGGDGLFFATWTCDPASGHNPKTGDWCIPKNGSQSRLNCLDETCEETDAVITGACCDAGRCNERYTSAECDAVGGIWHENMSCAQVGPCIPTVSEWGLVAMLLLVAAAGTVVIQRRRAVAA